MSSNQLTFANQFLQPLSEPHNRDAVVPALGSASRNLQRDPVLLGESLAVRRLRSQVKRIAPYFRIALISGETGSCKQLVARAIHALSPSADGPFIVANASAIAQSFANAEAAHALPAASVSSLLESAQGGTLYLDCVGELPFALQAALLRFLRLTEECRATPASTARNGLRIPALHQPDNRPMPTRILAATDRDLRILASIGQFRQDLYASLSTVEIPIPPLRQRSEDIPVLVAWMLQQIANQNGQGTKLLANDTLSQLQQRLWPNNLRELERTVAQAAALAEGAFIEPRHLLALVEPAQLPRPTAIPVERLHDIIHQHVIHVLTRCGGNKLRAAELLGISRSTLYRMLDANSVSTHSLTE